MLKTILAAAAVIPLLLGVAASMAAAEDAAPEPPRNRLSPTDDSELPQRTVPPLAPPQPLIQRRLSEPPPAETPPPQAAPPQTKAPSRAKAPPQAMKHRVATKQLATKQVKPQRVVARQAAPPRRAIAARTYRQDDTSLGALFTAGRTPPSRSPDAPPSTLTYNYFGAAPASPGDNGAPCPTRSRTSISALFTCKLR